MKQHQGIKLVYFYGITACLGMAVGAIAIIIRMGIGAVHHIQLMPSIDSWLLRDLACVLVTIIFVVSAYLLVCWVSPSSAGSGVQEIEGRLLYLRPIEWRKVIPIKTLGACFSIGSNMILGREGPTIQIGGNIGAMLSEKLGLNKHKADILIGAGAAAGLAAAFNAPLASVLFILEEMRAHFKLSAVSYKSVTIAAVFATIIIRLWYGLGPEINMVPLAPPAISQLPLFFIFGVVIGGCGLAFNRILIRLLALVDSLSSKQRLFFVIAVAVMVALFTLHYDFLVGGGYHIIQQSLHLRFSMAALFIILIIRFIGTLLCYSTGVPGGIFAPLLALGTVAGVIFGLLVNSYLPAHSANISMFAMAGMGGLFAACIRAPLTGIVLIVEMTQNYQMILPLMITCLTATTVVQFVNNPPLYHQLLKRVLTNEK